MHRKNCISGLFWVVFFLFFLWLDSQMGEEASYWPGIISRIGLVLSLASTLFSGLQWKASVGERILPFDGKQAKRLGLAFLLLLLWIVGMGIFGFLVSSAVFMALIGVIFEPVREKKVFIRDGIVAIVFAVGMFALFSALGISFPKGFLI